MPDPQDQLPPPPPGYAIDPPPDILPAAKPKADGDSLPPPPSGYMVDGQETHHPSVLETAYQYSGIPGAIEMGKGALKGVASTVFHGGDLVRRTTGMNRVIDKPEVQNLITPTNAAQSVGKGVEQAAEFLAPAGAVATGGKLVNAATKLPAARLLGRAVLDGLSAAGVAGAQTGGDPKAMATAGLTAGAVSGATGAVRAALPSKQVLADRLYGSALKPPPSMDAAERKAIIRTGQREGIVLNGDVVENVQKRISDVNQQISDEIAKRAKGGATVDPAAVANYTDRSASRFANQVNPESDLSAIKNTKDEFLRTNSIDAPYSVVAPSMTPQQSAQIGYPARLVPTGQQGATSIPQDIPLDVAQRMKQGTYAKLKNSYGEQAGAAREAQKDLARGLKDGIVQAFPEIANLNAKEGALINLEGALERFAGREGNKQLIGLGTPMTAVAAHAIGAPALPLTVIKAAMEFPEIKSRIAIALARAAAQQSAKTGINIAPGLAAAGVNAATQPPPPQNGRMPPP